MVLPEVETKVRQDRKCDTRSFSVESRTADFRQRRRPVISRFWRSMAIALIALSLRLCPAAAQTVIQDLPLANGSERVMYIGPPNPRATLILFVGSYGMVDFDANGVTGFEAPNFLVRA